MACPTGAVCKKAGITLETLPLLPGYWRSSTSATKLYTCDSTAACEGTNMDIWEREVWQQTGAITSDMVSRSVESDICSSG